MVVRRAAASRGLDGAQIAKGRKRRLKSQPLLGELHGAPSSHGFRMPAEWEKHERTWMVWPVRGDVWRQNAEPGQQAFATVAAAISRFEPVTIGAPVNQVQNARVMTKAAQDIVPPPIHPIDVVVMESDDAWCRDTGPIFVVQSAASIENSHQMVTPPKFETAETENCSKHENCSASESCSCSLHPAAVANHSADLPSAKKDATHEAPLEERTRGGGVV
eukprot:CAMPEP_0113937622 /NCGR_PEP_ID=MMETSP1339-20121228/4210_1 /TAXON_ID=94617 /ORGANISM="Fibrocapsa japonica" /LENGTH=218 /DNA_ID=CAMNT_0000940465 /DNA_START=46 /DNA_END=699 /DNA_ORIENTATION=+ /assembly_acc=CAM_ASM_000762